MHGREVPPGDASLYLRAPCLAPRCPREADRLVEHSLSCTISRERIARHNHMRKVLFEMARQANLNLVQETANLLPDSNNRPADLFLPNFTNGRGTCIDFTCTNSLQEATMVGCVDNGECTAEGAQLEVGQVCRQVHSGGGWPSCP